MSGLIGGYGRVEHFLHEVCVAQVYIDRETVGGLGVVSCLEFAAYQLAYGGKGVGARFGY